MRNDHVIWYKPAVGAHLGPFKSRDKGNRKTQVRPPYKNQI